MLFSKTLYALGTCVVLVSIANASPLIAIGEGQTTSWQDAINAGNIVFVPSANPFSDQADAFYANSILQAPFANNFTRSDVVDLISVPQVDIDGVKHDALIMSWNPPDEISFPDELGVAAWEYVYDADPNLTGTKSIFSIGAPAGGPSLWDLSYELVDVFGNVRSWFYGMPIMGWQNFVIVHDLQANQGPWAFQGQTPGFDITQVVSIQFDAAAWNGVMGFPAPPLGVTVGTWDWVGFDHLIVVPVPVPAAVWLFGSALGLLGWMRRKSA